MSGHRYFRYMDVGAAVDDAGREIDMPIYFRLDESAPDGPRAEYLDHDGRTWMSASARWLATGNVEEIAESEVGGAR